MADMPPPSALASLGETPPVAPGESPFHIKGVAYLGHLDWVDKHFPGKRPAFLALLSPTMRTFFSQTFLAIGFHDFLPLAAAGHACARSLGMRFVDFVEMRGRHQADLDLNGVYRILLKLTTAKMVAARLPKVMSKYFDFGDVRVLSEDAYAVRFEVDRVPSLAVDWFRGCYTGYVEVTVAASGGNIPTLDIDAQPAPALHGFAANRLVGTVRWG